MSSTVYFLELKTIRMKQNNDNNERLLDQCSTRAIKYLTFPLDFSREKYIFKSLEKAIWKPQPKVFLWENI